jgi:hypothetical protein
MLRRQRAAWWRVAWCDRSDALRMEEKLLGLRLDGPAHQLANGVLRRDAGVEDAINAFAEWHFNTHTGGDNPNRFRGGVPFDDLADLGQRALGCFAGGE